MRACRLHCVVSKNLMCTCVEKLAVLLLALYMQACTVVIVYKKSGTLYLLLKYVRDGNTVTYWLLI